MTMGQFRTSEGFEAFTTWDDVVSSAKLDPHSLQYWGALDIGPQRVAVVKIFKNGKIRVDPMSNQADRFTLDPGHCNAGMLYRKVG
jgi:hypothetical protein